MVTNLNKTAVSGINSLPSPGFGLLLFAIALQISVRGVALRLQAQPVLINELQSANSTTLTDENGDSSDWIELWNPGAEAFDLAGYGLSDESAEPFKWSFGPQSLIPAHGYLVVFASGKNRQLQAVAPIAPDQVPSLRAWLRADGIDPASTVQLRMAGGAQFLRQWRDFSGNGNHATQLTDNQQPLWIAAAAGGFAAVRFDGANDQLKFARSIGTNEFCVFAVYRTAQAHESDTESRSGVGGVSGQRWLFGAAHGGEVDAGLGVSVGTNGVSVYEHGSSYMPALLAHRNSLGDGIQFIAVNYTLHQAGLDHQGVLVRTGLSSDRRQVWAPVEIGSGAYGAFGGELLEILVFDRALAAAERQGLASYLASRYRITLPLRRHTNFQLNSAGDKILLTRPDGLLAGQTEAGPIPRDVSYGRAMADSSRWLFFGAPTPGTPNNTPGTAEWLSSPSFSHAAGFYSNAFNLTLASGDLAAEIRYTLDGSDPTPNSQLFLGPISIQSRAGTPNALSALQTVHGGLPPVGEVFKGWVVRARAIKADALSSPIVTRTYWVHPRGRARYSVAVISLATDRRNFFDQNIGIYVPGNTPGGNFFQRGPEWERPVHLEFIENDNRVVIDQDGDIKIHGNTSQGFPIKGLDVDGTGGAGNRSFRYPIFPDRRRTEFEHILLRPAGHDHYAAFMRDELMQQVAAETGAETQAARLCVVFLNGEYWGLHYLKEKEDAEFVSFYAEEPVDRLDYLEGYAVAKAGETAHYDAMLRFLASQDLSLPANYAQLKAWMEAPNYIDYKICEVFNYRWDIGNHRLWRPRTPEGRWRWLHFDNDVGWGGFWSEPPAWNYDMLAAELSADGRLHGHNNSTTTFLLRSLLSNSEFRDDFINRFADLLNTIFLPSRLLDQVERLAAPLRPEMAEHAARWRAPASLADWQRAVQNLREYAQLRPEFCRTHLRRQFNLGEPVQLSLAITPAGAGAVHVNTLELRPTVESPWRGTYFRGLPIRLTARAQLGYRFAGWTGLLGGASNDVRMVLQGDWAFTAQFEPEPAISVVSKLEARLTQPTTLQLTLSAPPNTRWSLEESADLRTWSPLLVVAVDAQGRGATSVTIGSSRRYFRVSSPRVAR